MLRSAPLACSPSATGNHLLMSDEHRPTEPTARRSRIWQFAAAAVALVAFGAVGGQMLSRETDVPQTASAEPLEAGEPSTPEQWFATRPSYCERTLEEYEWLEYEAQPPSMKYDPYPGLESGYAHMVDREAYKAALSRDDLTAVGLVLIEGVSGGEYPLEEAVDYALQPSSRTSQNLTVLLRGEANWSKILSVYAADEFCDFGNVPYHGVEYVEGD